MIHTNNPSHHYSKFAWLFLRTYPEFVFWQLRYSRRIQARDTFVGIGTLALTWLTSVIFHFTWNPIPVLIGILIVLSINHAADLWGTVLHWKEPQAEKVDPESEIEDLHR